MLLVVKQRVDPTDSCVLAFIVFNDRCKGPPSSRRICKNEKIAQSSIPQKKKTIIYIINNNIYYYY